MRRSVAWIAAMLAMIGPANSSPDENVRWLMNKPMSLMDWGIVELDRRLDDQLVSTKPSTQRILQEWRDAYRKEMNDHGMKLVNAFGRYEWGANRIVMQVGAQRSSGDPTSEDCLFVLRRTRDELLRGYMGDVLDLKLPEKRMSSATTFLSEMFRHPAGYVDDNRPENLYGRLAEVSIVRVSMFPLNDGFTGPSCHGSFVGSDLNVEVR
jgi:hypothetical protein